MNKTIETVSTRTLKKLSRYHWPGNIRELAKLIERAGILSQGSDLQVSIRELKLEGRPSASSLVGNKLGFMNG